MANAKIPIFSIHNPKFDRPELYLGETDEELAWLHLNPNPHKLRGAYQLLNTRCPPFLTFIGSSHVFHLSGIYNKEPLHYRELHNIGRMNVHKCGGLPENHRRFLQNASFVSCSGLKWSSAMQELNGIFQSYDKWKKYGDQWAKYRMTQMIIFYVLKLTCHMITSTPT